MNRLDVREGGHPGPPREGARVVAALTRRFGDLDIAEEAAAEAFARPPSSGGRPTACPWSQIEAK